MISDLYNLTKEKPKSIATALFIIICISSFAWFVYLQINGAKDKLVDQQVTLLQQQVSDLQSNSKKQKKINNIILAELTVLRTGFKELPPTMENVSGVFRALTDEPQISSSNKEKIEVAVTALTKMIDEVKSSLEKSEVISQTFSTFLSASAAEENNDIVAAVKLYKVAAKEGDPNAQFRLGALYAQGKGVDKDIVEATSFYQLAAFSGVPAAQVELATAYLQGLGVNQDPIQGAAWLEVVSESAPLSIQAMLLTVTKNMTDEQKVNILEASQNIESAIRNNPNKSLKQDK
jgi:cell division protein FtsB